MGEPARCEVTLGITREVEESILWCPCRCCMFQSTRRRHDFTYKLPSVALYFRLRSKNAYVVLYGCETWCHTLWEERGLRVFESRVLREQFGPVVEQVTGDGRKLRNEELHDKFSSPNKGGSDGQGMW